MSDPNPNCILPLKYEELFKKYKLNYNIKKDELQIYTKHLDLQFIKELKHMMVENFAIEISAVFYNDYKITIKLEKFTRRDPHYFKAFGE